MILLTLFVLGITVVTFNYIRNKAAERQWQRRERLQEKQQELLERLRNDPDQAVKEEHTDQ